VGVGGSDEGELSNMNRLEKLILEIKKQLLPYHHEHDIERGCERWAIDEEDWLTSWVAEQISNCRKKNRCDKKELCAYYGYSDIARKNYSICREVSLLFESGEASCIFKVKDTPK
jgi:hypothetical protein